MIPRKKLKSYRTYSLDLRTAQLQKSSSDIFYYSGLLSFIAVCVIVLSLLFNNKADPFAHNPFNQHTLQAHAWLNGSISLFEAPQYLELATFKGKVYNSFPPTPTIFELPLVLIQGRHTSNQLPPLILTMIAMILMFAVAVKFEFAPATAALIALSYIFGTNLLNAMVQNGIWHINQMEGFALSTIGFCAILLPKKYSLIKVSLGVGCFALAFGCRPFYLLYIPIAILILKNRFQLNWKQACVSALPFAFPILLAIAIYNFVRFENPFEFGHNFLPHAANIPAGIFSFEYFARNVYHAYLNFPEIGNWPKFLNFNFRGTAFWINNTVVLVAVALYANRSSLNQEERKEQIALLTTLGLILFLLSLHESNGWTQFGYRYIIDVLPLTWLMTVKARSRFSERSWMVVWCYSFVINCYGVYWFSRS